FGVAAAAWAMAAHGLWVLMLAFLPLLTRLRAQDGVREASRWAGRLLKVVGAAFVVLGLAVSLLAADLVPRLTGSAFRWGRAWARSASPGPSPPPPRCTPPSCWPPCSAPRPCLSPRGSASSRLAPCSRSAPGYRWRDCRRGPPCSGRSPPVMPPPSTSRVWSRWPSSRHCGAYSRRARRRGGGRGGRPG